MRLHATYSHLWLSLGVFTTITSNFNYFSQSYNYDATIENFILSVGWFLGLFSSINLLICPISHNNHQISHILKVFYGDIMVYFYVYIKIIFTICYMYHKYIFVCMLIMCMYVYCSYNEFKNKCLNYDISYSNLKIVIWFHFLLIIYIFNSKIDCQKNNQLFEFDN